MPMGPGGEDGDSAVTRRERLHMAGRIGNARIPDGKLQAGDKGDVVQRVAVFQCTRDCACRWQTAEGVLSWHTFVMGQCACVVRISVS